jgi:hypothetical protein
MCLSSSQAIWETKIRRITAHRPHLNSRKKVCKTPSQQQKLGMVYVLIISGSTNKEDHDEFLA